MGCAYRGHFVRREKGEPAFDRRMLANRRIVARVQINRRLTEGKRELRKRALIQQASADVEAIDHLFCGRVHLYDTII